MAEKKSITVPEPPATPELDKLRFDRSSQPLTLDQIERLEAECSAFKRWLGDIDAELEKASSKDSSED